MYLLLIDPFRSNTLREGGVGEGEGEGEGGGRERGKEEGKNEKEREGTTTYVLRSILYMYVCIYT